LPLQGPLPEDAEALAHQLVAPDARRHDAGGQGDADRVSHRARDRLRAREGPRQARRVRVGPHDVHARGRLEPRLQRAERPGAGPRRRVVPPGDQRHQLRLQLGLHRRQARRLPAVGVAAGAGEGHLARLPGPRHGRIRLAALRRAPAHDEGAVERAAAHAVDQDYIVSWNNKQAPGFAAADDQWGYGPTYRQAMLVANIKSELAKGGGKMTLP